MTTTATHNFVRADFEAQLRGFVAAGSGLAPELVLAGNQDAPMPDALCATVLLISDWQVGYSVILSDSDTGEQRQRQSRRAIYSVQWFREGARAAADAFVQWADSDVGVLDANERGFRLQDFSPVRQIDAAILSGPGAQQYIEERASVDMTVAYFADSVYTPGYAEFVPINVFGEIDVVVSE